MVLPGLYMWLHPDGDLHPGRYTDGFWIRALKFSPPPHVPSFLFGIALADLDGMISRTGWKRLMLGVMGMGGLYLILYFGDRMPYPMMHDGLLMPLFGLAILGLAGHNLIARFFGFFLFTAIGRASYCLYLLHFNLWLLIHDSHLLDRLHLAQFDPWISYFLLVAGAMLVMVCIERPCQRWIRRWIESIGLLTPLIFLPMNKGRAQTLHKGHPFILSYREQLIRTIPFSWQARARTAAPSALSVRWICRGLSASRRAALSRANSGPEHIGLLYRNSLALIWSAAHR